MTNTNFINVSDFLKLIVKFENNSAEFYKNLKGKINKPDVLTLLNMLEEQERQHAKIIGEFDSSGMSEAILQFAPDFTLSMPGLQDISINNDPSFDEMLELAIKREIKTAQIYENAASQTRGDLKKLLEGLSVFEREHEERLKKIKLY